MQLQHALYSINDGLAVITLNRPEARNALSEEMRADLDWIIQDLKAKAGTEVKALVITGAGNSFCAGGDVKAMNDPKRNDVVAGRARMRRSQTRLFELLHLELPVIAAVNGHAAGAGFGLALMADFVFAGPSTRFTCSFARIGLIPDWGLLYTLPRAIGMQKAKDIIFTGRRVKPDEAKSLGLVHTIVENDEDLVTSASDFARRFCKASTTAISTAKVLLQKSFESDHRTMLEFEAFGQAQLYPTEFHKDAIKRFATKEPAIFDWEQLERDGRK